MKKALFLLLITLAAAPLSASTHFQMSGDLAADFLQSPDVQTILDAFGGGTQPLMYGMEWEVIFNRVGFGGTYLVNFFKDGNANWWLDWYGHGISLNYHLFGGGAFLDPLLTVGVGCSGRVYLGDGPLPAGIDPLYISLFPFAGLGLALNLDGFLLKGKLVYTPFLSPPPVTRFQNYPMGSFQFMLSAGLSVGK
jgi:hypothetical protein